MKNLSFAATEEKINLEKPDNKEEMSAAITRTREQSERTTKKH